MRILIIYGTSEGQTRKITRFMEAVLQEAGHLVAISNAIEEPPSPKGYDAVLVGASVHMGKYQSALRHYVITHAQALRETPSAFFHVGLAVISEDPQQQAEVHQIERDLLEEANWKPLMTVEIAGALRYSKYDFFKRWVMQMISKREGRPTDPSEDIEYTGQVFGIFAFPVYKYIPHPSAPCWLLVFARNWPR